MSKPVKFKPPSISGDEVELIDEVSIIVDNVYSCIKCLDHKIIKLLRNKFKVERDYYTWKNNPALRFIFLVSENGRFLTGLVDDIYQSLIDDCGVIPKVLDYRDMSMYPDKYQKQQNYKKLNVVLRPYQKEGLKIAMKTPRGVFEWPTGSGKTVLIASTIGVLGVTTVVFCGKKDLAKQTREELRNFLGQPIGLIGDGVFDVQPVTVAIVASVTNKRINKEKKKKIEAFLESVRYMVIDEVHHIASPSYQKATGLCKNAAYRHGFSASFITSKITKAFATTNAEGEKVLAKKTVELDPIVLLLHTGPVIHSIPIKQLVEEGYLSTPEVRGVTYNHFADADHCRGLAFTEVYGRDISRNAARNILIAGIIKDEFDSGSQILVFVREISQGEEIKNMLEQHFGVEQHHVGFICGEDDMIIRNKQIVSFQGEKLPILIGTSIIGEGLNFFCNAAINAAAGDSEIQTIQRFGRILRKKKNTGEDIDTSLENKVIMYEIFDSGHPFFVKHARSRKKVYTELGYKPENIIDGISYMEHKEGNPEITIMDFVKQEEGDAN